MVWVSANYYIIFTVCVFREKNGYSGEENLKIKYQKKNTVPTMPTVQKLVVTGNEYITASVAEWLRVWDTSTMFEATVCGSS